MANVNITINYSLDMPEVDDIYNLDDHDLIDEKLNELEDEISNDPLYFIERFGSDVWGEVIL
jgi:hypothetical protein|nr:MAG TPA: hypothetical protein [Caudoviricetes sp.]